MTVLVTLLAGATATLGIGDFTLAPADIIDGRAIASATGSPEVMLTLTPAAARRIATVAPAAVITLNGQKVTAHVTRNIVEIEGQSDYAAAEALALQISGKPPLPDSSDE